jgi:hypothetical protein
MAHLDDVMAGQDALYETMGVAASWTPAGGTPVAFTGLVSGGDKTAQLHGVTVQLNMAARGLRARVRELAALAPGRVPARGDAVQLLNDLGAVTDTLVITDDPLREDPRRLEWTLDLAVA